MASQQMARLQSRARGAAQSDETEALASPQDSFSELKASNKLAPLPLDPFEAPHTSSSTACISRRVLLLAVMLSLLLTVSILYAKTAVPTHANFITVQQTKFMDGCRPFYVSGFNVDNIVEAAISEVSRRQSTSKPAGRQMVANLMQTAAQSSLNTLRIWGHTADPAHPFQVTPGVYNEEVFKALDFVIAQASQAGLRVIISFVDNWRYRGGVDEMVDWSPSVPKRDSRFPPLVVGDVTPDMLSQERAKYESMRKSLFFTDPGAQKIYKDHVSAILNRKNVYTRRRYKDEKCILSFNLINEARCDTTHTPECSDYFQRWIETMAEHFHSIDKNHLLTVGIEGFWGFGDVNNKYNPGAADGSTWASETGQIFIANHNVKGISYASIHSWPDNFNESAALFHETWLTKHAEDAANILQKPVLLEEVGKKLNSPVKESAVHKYRDPVFDRIHKAVEYAAATASALAGSMFWQIEFQIYDQSPQSPYDIKPTDSTFELITAHSKRLNGFMHSQPPTCTASCFVGTVHAGGLVRRCTNQPHVCLKLRDHATYNKKWNQEEERLVIPQVLVFSSQQECCRAGYGAFENGCSTSLF